MEKQSKKSQKTLKKNSEEGLALSNSNPYYKGSVIKTAWCWYMNLRINETEQKESPENRHINGNSVYGKGGISNQQRNMDCSVNGIETTGQLCGKK